MKLFRDTLKSDVYGRQVNWIGFAFNQIRGVQKVWKYIYYTLSNIQVGETTTFLQNFTSCRDNFRYQALEAIYNKQILSNSLYS